MYLYLSTAFGKKRHNAFLLSPEQCSCQETGEQQERFRNGSLDLASYSDLPHFLPLVFAHKKKTIGRKINQSIFDRGEKESEVTAWEKKLEVAKIGL